MSEFETKNKGPVEIRVDDDDQITVFDPDGHKIGHVSVSFEEGADERFGTDDAYRITNIYLDGPGNSGTYKRQGIGRECIRILSQDFGYNVVVSPDDGNVRDDGSHLTRDAPAFFRRMAQEGLISFSD